ncbi:hypothetical protein HZ326_23787 [Fusarium oxysporum f. sp. albedinis]|nr:putative 2-oxoglutarate/malate carrier protein [Fusarium oxysporum f. sp. albedinis]KAJ0133139.1 hypothetical protein HZ326_23787 [Fusarium oxysporum f. sp. albedinis]
MILLIRQLGMDSMFLHHNIILLPVASGMPTSVGQPDMVRNNVSRSRANQPLYRLIDDIIRSAGEPAILRQMVPPGTRIDWPVEDLAKYEARCHSITTLQVNSIVDFSALDFAGADIAEQLGNLIVFCSNYPRGCTKQTRRRDMLTHALNCSDMS